MNRSIASILTVATLAAWAAITAACASTPPENSPTAAVSATDSALAKPPDATATALFEAINRKYAAIGRETLPPGTDALHPYADITPAPARTVTPGPSATPEGPQCGATIAGWPEILAKYGGFYKGSRCGVYGTQLVITTRGATYGATGAIATYQCEATDASCLIGGPPQAPGATWSVYPAPLPGGVEIADFSRPDIILIVPGRYCFNLTTHTYNLGQGCFPR